MANYMTQPGGFAPAAPQQQAPTGLNFQSDAGMRSQFKGFMSNLGQRAMPQPAPQAVPAPSMMPEIPAQMAGVDIFQPVQNFRNGGGVGTPITQVRTSTGFVNVPSGSAGTADDFYPSAPIEMRPDVLRSASPQPASEAGFNPRDQFLLDRFTEQNPVSAVSSRNAPILSEQTAPQGGAASFVQEGIAKALDDKFERDVIARGGRIYDVNPQVNAISPITVQDGFGVGMNPLEQLGMRSESRIFEETMPGLGGLLMEGMNRLGQGVSRNIAEKIEAGGQPVLDENNQIVGVVHEGGLFGGRVYTGRPGYDPIGARAEGGSGDFTTLTGDLQAQPASIAPRSADNDENDPISRFLRNLLGFVG